MTFITGLQKIREKWEKRNISEQLWIKLFTYKKNILAQKNEKNMFQ